MLLRIASRARVAPPVVRISTSTLGAGRGTIDSTSFCNDQIFFRAGMGVGTRSLAARAFQGTG
jgi:hypothetical protein